MRKFIILSSAIMFFQTLSAQTVKQGNDASDEEVVISSPKMSNTCIKYVEDLDMIHVDYTSDDFSSKDIEVQVYKDGNLLIDDVKQGISDDMNGTYPILDCENGDYEVVVIEDNEIIAVENITVE